MASTNFFFQYPILNMPVLVLCALFLFLVIEAIAIIFCSLRLKNV